MGFAHGAGPRRAFLGPAGSSRGLREEGMALPEEEMAPFPPDTTLMVGGTTGSNAISGFKDGVISLLCRPATHPGQGEDVYPRLRDVSDGRPAGMPRRFSA